MKILYIVNSLSVGGAETIAANYAVELSKRGHSVSMIQIKNEDTFLKDMVVDAGIQLYTTESATRGKTGKLDKLLSIIRFCHYIHKINPDIIHVHTGLEKFRFVKGFPAERIFYTIHSEWNKCKEKGHNHKKMLFELINKGMNVIVLSSKAKSDVVGEFPSAKVTVLPNGMDLDKIRNTSYDRNFLYDEFAIPKDAFVIGHVGRFHPVKNHEKLIHIFEEVAHLMSGSVHNDYDNNVSILQSDNTCVDSPIYDSNYVSSGISHVKNTNTPELTPKDTQIVSSKDTVILLLIGGGSEEEQSRIHSLVELSPLRNNVIFAGVRQDATAIMGALDTIVMPSFSEAFPLVPIEAQIMGTRCILSDVIPDEVFCNDNCIPMSLSSSDETWAKAVLGKWTVNNTHELNQFSLVSVIDKHIDMYKASI